MKSIILPLGIFLSFVQSNWGQTYSYSLKLHDKFRTDQREIPEDYVESDENGHYLIYSKGKYGQGGSSLVKFDKEFMPTGKKIALTRSYDKEDAKEHSLGILESNGKLLNITTTATKELRKFYSKSVDLKDFKISERKEILNLSIEGVNMKRPYMKFFISKNAETLGLFCALPSKAFGNVQKYRLLILDYCCPIKLKSRQKCSCNPSKQVVFLILKKVSPPFFS